MKFSLYSHMVFIFFSSFFITGNLLSPTLQHRPTAKQKHYGTTVPLRLVGQDWKPLSQLKSQVKRRIQISALLLLLVRLFNCPFFCPPLILISTASTVS